MLNKLVNNSMIVQYLVDLSNHNPILILNPIQNLNFSKSFLHSTSKPKLLRKNLPIYYLLKNEKNLLPVDPAKTPKILVTGPAAHTAMQGGGSGSVPAAVNISAVEGLLNPALGALFSADSLKEAWTVTIPSVSGGEPATLMFGAVVAAAIQFLLVAAAVYFALVMPMNRVRAHAEARRAAGAPPEEVTTTGTRAAIVCEMAVASELAITGVSEVNRSTTLAVMPSALTASPAPAAATAPLVVSLAAVPAGDTVCWPSVVPT